MKQAYIILIVGLFFSCAAFSQSNSLPVKSLTSSEFKKIVDAKSALLIDVRTAEEFSEGHIPGAINIDVKSDNFVTQIKKLTKYKVLALYCRSGHRSKIAASKISDLGFLIYELDNGFKDWIQAGFPTSKK